MSASSPRIAPTSDLQTLLSRGHTYLWAIRQGQLTDPEELEAARRQFEEEAIDTSVLQAMRHLEHSIARYPYPAKRTALHTRYLKFPMPFQIELYFNEIVTEHGLELGLELFPVADWTFAHRETHICTGGDTNWTMTHPNGSQMSRRVLPGNVAAFPAGTHFLMTKNGEYGHAHVYLMNISEAEGQVYYDAPGVMRLQALGLIPTPGGEDAPELYDITDRIELTDWRELLAVRDDAEHDLPTWLRNGWKAKDATRALDYAEGTKVTVMNSPDREPKDFVDWGAGSGRCQINPLIAEQTCAVTDCVFPNGYRRALPKREMWAVLDGHATVRQSLPVFHAEWVEYEVQSGDVLVVADGAYVEVADAKNLTVRRFAETCAHNSHAEMMERKLELDGVARELQ
jgi:hypothetical protein